MASETPSNEITQDDLLCVASAVRGAIQNLSETRHPIALRIENTIKQNTPNAPATFPRNWCDYASCVLAFHIARILKTGDINLCMGQKVNSSESHWWLKVGGWDVDITADQFPQNEETVVVEKNSVFHDQSFPDYDVAPFLSRHPQPSYFEFHLFRLDKVLQKSETLGKISLLMSCKRCGLEVDILHNPEVADYGK